MTTSNKGFWTRGRALAAAGLISVLGPFLPATSHSAAIPVAVSSQSEGQGQQASQGEQMQAGGLHVPERGREHREKGDRALLILAPATAVTAPGDELNVRLFVLGAQELLRLPATLHYDPEVVRVVSVRAGAAWKSGTVPTLMYDSSRPGELVVGLARLGSDVSPLTGNGGLLQITLEAIAPGETELTLKRFALLGRGTRSQRVEARTAKVSVQ